MGTHFWEIKGKTSKKKSMSSSPFIDKIHKHYKTETKTSAPSVQSEKCEAEMAATNNTTREDERGFMKTENFTVMDPREANFQETVKLVERNPCPNGFQLVDPAKSGKKNQFDLVELAANIQKADQFTRATAGSKLSVIAEHHHIACNFKKVPGKIYYVYRREESGAKYMS